MKRRTIVISVLVICASAAVAGFALYQSLPHGRPGTTHYWVIYTLTLSGNHTQIQTDYYNGNNYTSQIYWLDFNNRTAVYNYFKCTPSMPDCTLDGCTFKVLVNTATEYQIWTGDPCKG